MHLGEDIKEATDQEWMISLLRGVIGAGGGCRWWGGRRDCGIVRLLGGHGLVKIIDCMVRRIWFGSEKNI